MHPWATSITSGKQTVAASVQWYLTKEKKEKKKKRECGGSIGNVVAQWECGGSMGMWWLNGGNVVAQLGMW
jgi:hypothetical protein